MTTLIGSSTAIVRGAIAFRCSRTQNSSRLYSTRFSARPRRCASRSHGWLPGVSPASHPTNGGHTGIVPAAHEPALHELDELALGQHGVGQAKAGELDLLRVVHVQRVEHPVVQLAVVDELQRADGVRNAFQRVPDRQCVKSYMG